MQISPGTDNRPALTKALPESIVKGLNTRNMDNTKDLHLHLHMTGMDTEFVWIYPSDPMFLAFVFIWRFSFS